MTRPHPHLRRRLRLPAAHAVLAVLAVLARTGARLGVLTALAAGLSPGLARLAAPAYADPSADPGADPGAAPGWAVNDLPTTIDNLTGWLVGISATVATFFLTWGWLKYLMAGGDPSELEKAKHALRNAGIGYAGMLLTPAILLILKQILGVS